MAQKHSAGQLDRLHFTKKLVQEGKNDEPRVTQCEFLLLVLLTIMTCSLKRFLEKLNLHLTCEDTTIIHVYPHVHIGGGR